MPPQSPIDNGHHPMLKSGQPAHVVQQMGCPKCKAKIDFTIFATQVINKETVSLVLLEHSGEVVCNCGAVLMPVVISLSNIQIGAAEVPPEMRRHLIHPASNLPS